MNGHSPHRFHRSRLCITGRRDPHQRQRIESAAKCGARRSALAKWKARSLSGQSSSSWRECPMERLRAMSWLPPRVIRAIRRISGGGSYRGEPASGHEPGHRRRRQHLRHVLRIARTEGSGCDLPHRFAADVKPFVHEMMNATGLAFGRAGACMFPRATTARCTGWRKTEPMTSYAEGMGVATGIAFDEGQSLCRRSQRHHLQNRPQRQIFVFAMLEPSVSAYHLAFAGNGNLYVTGPTTSSFDAVYRSIRTATSACFTAAWVDPKD